MNYKLKVVWIEGEEKNWKFLIREDNHGWTIIHNFNDEDKFVDCQFGNFDRYKSRNAKQKDLDEALVNKI